MPELHAADSGCPDVKSVRLGCELVRELGKLLEGELLSDGVASVPDWATIQATCHVSFNNTMPSGLLYDSDSPSASNGTSYNVTASVGLCFAAQHVR